MSAARKARRAAEREKAKDAKRHDKSMARCADLWDSLNATFGVAPSSPEITAAHEAGHLIVGLTNGGEFIECRINGGVSANQSGYTTVRIPGVHGGAFRVTDDPMRAMAYAMQEYGGIAGEIAAGLYHPSSAVDEATTVYGIARALDGNDPLRVFGRISDAACNAIDVNRNAFDHARTLLLQKGAIDQADADAIVGLMVKRGDWRKEVQL